MKIILFGSNGMLGSYLKSYLELEHTIVEITRKDIDLSVVDEAELLSFLTKKISKGDIIVNAAGVIKQRSYNTLDMVMVNSVFPHILAKFKGQVDFKGGAYGILKGAMERDLAMEGGGTESSDESRKMQQMMQQMQQRIDLLERENRAKEHALDLAERKQAKMSQVINCRKLLLQIMHKISS